MAASYTLAARRAAQLIEQGEQAFLRADFLVLRKPGTTTGTPTTYRVVSNIAKTYSAGSTGTTGTPPQTVYSGNYTVVADETYDRIYLCGSVGAYAVNDATALQAIVDGLVSAPVLDPTSDNSICISYQDITPTAYTIGQVATPQITTKRTDAS